MRSRTRTLAGAALAALIVTPALLWPAAAMADSPQPPRPALRRIHVRVWEPGAVAPSVSVSVPVVLVTMVVRVASLTGLLDRSLEEARAEAGRCGAPDGPMPFDLKGRDLAAAWSAIARSGPADLVRVEEGDGSRVVIRID